MRGDKTDHQLGEVESKVVYFGFNSDEKGIEYSKKTIREVEATSKYFLNWNAVGIKSP